MILFFELMITGKKSYIVKLSLWGSKNVLASTARFDIHEHCHKDNVVCSTVNRSLQAAMAGLNMSWKVAQL